MPVSRGAAGRRGIDMTGGRFGERYLEGERDERVHEADYGVGRYSCDPAPDDELPEVEGRMALWLDVFLVRVLVGVFFFFNSSPAT